VADLLTLSRARDLREILNAVYHDLKMDHYDAALLGVGLAISKLDNSRETTEKITELEVPIRYLQYGDTLTAHYVVTNHKARIVLDD